MDGEDNKESVYIQTLIKVIESEANVVTFLHNTRTRETAMKVLQEGFEFQSHIDYTTDVVTAKDPITIKYFTIVRQAYGTYTLVIQISKHLIEHYALPINNTNHHFSEILSVKPPYHGAEDDLVFCLAPHFVRGFINSETAEFFPNPAFNASLVLPIFDENITQIVRQL